MKIVVLAGGLSPERDVSLSSGSLIANSLIRSDHDVMLLDLYLGINNRNIPSEYRNKSCEELYSYNISTSEPDLDEIKKLSLNEDILIGNGVLDICMDADVVFMALHGGLGENGKLQALFDIYNVNYTGTGYEGSLLAMNKKLSKQIMLQNDILTAPFKVIGNSVDVCDVSFPCVVKPISCGSSVGISIVHEKDELEKALVSARKWEDEILIESFIEGREFSVGILNGNALPVIEIKPKKGFYDYENKYQMGSTEEICPAMLSVDETELLQSLALKVHEVLNLGYYSRIDFILDNDGNAYCLEANTLPGMTPTSLFPQEARAVGMTYDDLCENIVLSVNK